MRVRAVNGPTGLRFEIRMIKPVDLVKVVALSTMIVAEVLFLILSAAFRPSSESRPSMGGVKDAPNHLLAKKSIEVYCNTELVDMGIGGRRPILMITVKGKVMGDDSFAIVVKDPMGREIETQIITKETLPTGTHKLKGIERLFEGTYEVLAINTRTQDVVDRKTVEIRPDSPRKSGDKKPSR